MHDSLQQDYFMYYKQKVFLFSLYSVFQACQYKVESMKEWYQHAFSPVHFKVISLTFAYLRI